nr:MAG TPA: protein of unknown function (DUF4355) [Caudoviricetes sp.]
MADRPGRPEEDDTKTGDASPVPAGQEDAAKPAAAPKAANEGDATNPQTDRAAADTEEKPEPTGADEPASPADADTDKPATAPSPAEPAEKPEADNTGTAPAPAVEAEPAVDWESRATAAEKELADLKLKVAAQNAAAEAGLPPEAGQFLRGDNDEEIKAAAETLASLITPTSPLDRNPVPRGQEPDDRPDLATIGARLFRN